MLEPSIQDEIELASSPADQIQVETEAINTDDQEEDEEDQEDQDPGDAQGRRSEGWRLCQARR